MNDAATPETHQDLLRYLWRLGHFNEPDENNFATRNVIWERVYDLQPEDPQVKAAILSWKRFRSQVTQEPVWDNLCRRAVAREAQYRCALPDVMQREALGAAWPAACKHDITTCHSLEPLSYPETTAQTTDDAWDQGLQLWNVAADLTMSRIPACPTTRISAQTQHLGRYILAWSELANGDCAARLQQAYNLDIAWDWHLLWTTICHEIGHAIGIAHGGTGMMQPAHDPTVNELGQWEITQLVERYGEPTTPPIPPTPGPGEFHHALITLFNERNDAIGAYDVRPRF